MIKLSMRMQLLSELAVAAVLIAGCSTPTHVDKGTIKATSFSFVNPGPLPEYAYRENRQQVNAIVQEAIASDLTAKGVKYVAQGGEVTVAYLIIVGNNVSTSAINEYFGYGADATALADKAQKAYTEGKQRGFFEAGTLLIDIVDSGSNKLLARNYVTRPVLQNPSADDRKAHIQEAVQEALQSVRFER
jgi:uncharacterized lipoprotein YajG